MQNDALCALVDYWTDNYNSKIIIETNGTLIDERTLRHLHILGGDDIYISISPKTLESFTNIFNIDIPIDTFRRHISFKAVVGSQKFPTSNWEALLFKAAKNGHPIYLMPEGVTQEELIKNLKYVEKVGGVLEDNYKLSPRMHIFLGIK